MNPFPLRVTVAGEVAPTKNTLGLHRLIEGTGLLTTGGAELELEPPELQPVTATEVHSHTAVASIRTNRFIANLPIGSARPNCIAPWQFCKTDVARSRVSNSTRAFSR